MDEILEWLASLFGKTTKTTRSGTTQTITVGKVAYINKVDVSGWIGVKLSNGSIVSVCMYTKLTILSMKNSRCFFRIEDGSYKGNTASFAEANAKIYIGSKAPSQTAAIIKATPGKLQSFRSDVRKQTLQQQLTSFTAGSVSGKATLNTPSTGAQYSALPKGKYEILVPDTPHSKDYTRYYREADSELKYDQVWFPIRYGNNSRYVHVGHISEGCFTVVELDKFTQLHDYLISHRAENNTIVGYLEIA